ncbi:hypothetical protein PIB30_081352, partial [Stylosanthes scabra]|nr:hypothetical protein [Stylosanthes scabra]
RLPPHSPNSKPNHSPLLSLTSNDTLPENCRRLPLHSRTRFVASYSPTFRRFHLREVEGALLFHRPPVVALAALPSSSPLGSFIFSGAAPSQPPAVAGIVGNASGTYIALSRFELT